QCRRFGKRIKSDPSLWGAFFVELGGVKRGAVVEAKPIIPVLRIVDPDRTQGSNAEIRGRVGEEVQWHEINETETVQIPFPGHQRVLNLPDPDILPLVEHIVYLQPAVFEAEGQIAVQVAPYARVAGVFECPGRTHFPENIRGDADRVPLTRRP